MTSFLKYAASLVSYNQSTGKMVWLPRPDNEKDSARWNARYSGKECGTIDDKGYKRILIRSFDGTVKRIRLHQLAWFIANGKKQSGEIDHINQNKLDNRIKNLRDVSKSLNQRNGTRKKNNTSGVTGVCWHKQHKKWYAQATSNGVKHFIGLFESLEDAEKSVRDFRSKHGFTKNHGRSIVHTAAEIGKGMK